MRAGVKQGRDVEVERVPDPRVPKGRLTKQDDPAEVDAEARATEALAVQRDWSPDLSGVRLHEGPDAAAASASIGAAAFTQGNDVYLGAGVDRGTPQGDHVLAHELAHVEQGHQSDEIHRFPATALTQGPVDWPAETADVSKPGGGVSGGVFFLHAKDPQGGIETIVVKPIFGASGLGTKESGETMQMGDEVMSSLLGITTPDSRVINSGTPEWQQLHDLCLPKHPTKPVITDEMSLEESAIAQGWQPLAAAKQFIVMGKVPGDSVSSLAGKAVTDGSAMSTLRHSLLDQGFMIDLGRMCVGDLLIGNNDRIVAGAMNVGNIMIEAQGESTAKLWAIDTNAVLGDIKDPAEILKSGSTSSSMEARKGVLSSLKERQQIFEGFFDVILDKMEGAQKLQPATDGPTPFDLFKEDFTKGKEMLYAAFLAGWDDAMTDVMVIFGSQPGRDKAKGIVGKHGGGEGEGDGDIQFDKLSMNAEIISTIAGGGNVEDKTKDIAGRAALQKFAKLDPTTMAIPVDEHHYDKVSGPVGSALDADYEPPEALVWPTKIKGIGWGPFIPGNFEAVSASAKAAKAEGSQLGTKTRGLGRKELPRNRVLANDYITSLYLAGAGAIRAISSARELEKITAGFNVAANAQGTPQQFAAVAPAAKFLKSYHSMLTMALEGFGSVMANGAKNVKKLHSRSKPAVKFKDVLAENLTAIAGNTTGVGVKSFLGGAEKGGLLTAAETILERAKEPREPMEEVEVSEQAKARGRKPLIGSRGKK